MRAVPSRPARARRLRTAAVGAVGVAGATGGAASLLADRVVRIRRRTRYRHHLVALDGDTVVLRRDQETARPGTYGLSAPGAHAVIGEVIGEGSHEGNGGGGAGTDGLVRRPLLRLDHGALRPGRVALDHVHVGDPRASLGLHHETVTLDGECGPLPVWVLPGGDTWVVLAHGLGGSLQSSLSFLPFLHAAGHSLLVASYRNDPGAGASPDRRYHLGADEWRDLEAAMAFALGRGARQVVLFGWSLGAAVALQALARSELAGSVAGLVLDSPVLCWRRVLHHVGRRSAVPPPLVALSLRLVERRIGTDLDALDWLGRAGELSVPVLDFHGETDPTVPFTMSAELARRRPDLVELVVVPGAGHVGSWNVDPHAYGRHIADFVAGLSGPGVAPPGAKGGADRAID